MRILSPVIDRRSRIYSGILSAVLLLLPSMSGAQTATNPSPAQPAAVAAPTPADAAKEAKARLRLTADWQLASWLIADAETQVALGNAAIARLPSGVVRTAVERDLADDQKLLDDLRPFRDREEAARGATEKLLMKSSSSVAPASARSGEVSATVDVASADPAVPVVPVPAATASSAAQGGDGGAGTVVIAKMGGAGFDLVSLRRDLAKQTLASSMAYLETKQGDELSRAYGMLRAAAISRRLDTLHVFQEHASTKLKPVLEAAIKQSEARQSTNE